MVFQSIDQSINQTNKQINKQTINQAIKQAVRISMRPRIEAYYEGANERCPVNSDEDDFLHQLPGTSQVTDVITPKRHPGRYIYV